MKKLTLGTVVALCCFALSLGGCAKKELIKGEGEVPAGSTIQQPVEKPASAKPEVTEEAVKQPAVKEAPVSDSDQSAAAGQQLTSLDNIYFDFDSYVLSAKARETLTANAGMMKKNDSVNIQVAGHCDERGSDEYNLALGEKRAKAAMDYIVTLGIPASRLSTISYGKEKPLDPGHDEAAWAKNRRDEFTIIVK
jgi:peptidoglycan-associated lipoprotein